MANRYFYQFLNMFEKGPVILFVKASIGATGAPTLDTTVSRGIKSITRTGVGAYTIALEDRYQKVLMITRGIQSSTLADGNVSMTLIADNSSNTSPDVRVAFAAPSTGSAAELSNGVTLTLKIILRNSSAPV